MCIECILSIQPHLQTTLCNAERLFVGPRAYQPDLGGSHPGLRAFQPNLRASHPGLGGGGWDGRGYKWMDERKSSNANILTFQLKKYEKSEYRQTDRQSKLQNLFKQTVFQTFIWYVFSLMHRLYSQRLNIETNLCIPDDSLEPFSCVCP